MRRAGPSTAVSSQHAAASSHAHGPPATSTTKVTLLDIRITTTDYEGRPVAAEVSLNFVLRTWQKVTQKANEYDSDYQMVEDDLSSVKIKTNQQATPFTNILVTTPGNIAIETKIYENGKEYTSVGGFICGSPDKYGPAVPGTTTITVR